MNRIDIETWTGDHVVIECERFFPCSKYHLCALHKHLIHGCKNEREVLQKILDYLIKDEHNRECEYAKYEDPYYEMKKSAKFRQLQYNIKRIQHYLDKLQRC